MPIKWALFAAPVSSLLMEYADKSSSEAAGSTFGRCCWFSRFLFYLGCAWGTPGEVKGADLGLEPEVVPVVLPCRHPGGSAGEGHPGDPGGSPVQCRGALVGGRMSAAAAPGDSREQAEGSGQSSLPYPLPTDDY